MTGAGESLHTQSLPCPAGSAPARILDGLLHVNRLLPPSNVMSGDAVVILISVELFPNGVLGGRVLINFTNLKNFE